MPSVSVITVNFNGKGLTVECLRTLKKQSLRDFEIIIVDNASSDDSVSEVQTFLEESHLSAVTKLITLSKNTGFAAGSSEGLKHARGKYIALLNNDTEPCATWLEDLVKAMESDPCIGICASKLIAHGTDIIDSAGDGFSSFLRGFKRGEGEKATAFNRMEYIFGACAGAALYRREMINEIGFLDEDFFLLNEDTDLNLRAQLFGWKVVYVPDAIVHHKVRSTIGEMSETAIYYALRNSKLVRIKNIPIPVYLRYLPVLALGALLEFIYFVVLYRHPIIYCKAKLDAIKMLPCMLKKRRVIMASMRKDNKYLTKTITPLFERGFLNNKFRKFILG